MKKELYFKPWHHHATTMSSESNDAFKGLEHIGNFCRIATLTEKLRFRNCQRRKLYEKRTSF